MCVPGTQAESHLSTLAQAKAPWQSMKQVSKISNMHVYKHKRPNTHNTPPHVVQNHRITPLHHTTTSHHSITPPHRTTASHHHIAPPHRTTASHHRIPTPHRTTASHHRMIPPHRTTV
jgi:hypothetical protein